MNKAFLFTIQALTSLVLLPLPALHGSVFQHDVQPLIGDDQTIEDGGGLERGGAEGLTGFLGDHQETSSFSAFKGAPWLVGVDDIRVSGGIWTTLATSVKQNNGNLAGWADSGHSLRSHGTLLFSNVEGLRVSGI